MDFDTTFSLGRSTIYIWEYQNQIDSGKILVNLYGTFEMLFPNYKRPSRRRIYCKYNALRRPLQVDTSFHPFSVNVVIEQVGRLIYLHDP